MLVRHIQANRHLEQEIDPARAVGVFHRSGDAFFSQYTTRQSRYEGWYMCEQSTLPHNFYKLIERIELKDVIGAPHSIERSRVASRFNWQDKHLSFQVSGSTSLTIESNGSPILLTLDVRGIYAAPEMRRMYSFSGTGDGILIHYKDELTDRPIFTHIRGLGLTAAEVEAGTAWIQVDYPRDMMRNSSPWQRHVLTLPASKTPRLACGSGFTESAAVAASALAASTEIQSFVAAETVSPEELASISAAESLQDLRTADGYYAGLPWFFQFWSRDELLSGLGLPPDEQLELIRTYLDLPLDHGELPTFAGSGTTCADGVGWLALLIKEYGLDRLSADDRNRCLSFFVTAWEQLTHHRLTPSGLIWSGHNATWMDTVGRVGCRVEIQAMAALVLEVIHEIGKDPQYAHEKESLHQSIRHHLMHEGRLLDGLDENLQKDTAVKPNVFLAYLLQPSLLTPEEWSTVFSHTLTSLQTSWGGLRSLEKNHPLYQDLSTGENNASYHNGDSWFFVNNLAVTALRRHNQPSLLAAADSIFRASTEEILWHNLLGCPGEIASAANAESWGCGIQGFSAGAYLLAIS